MGKKYTIDQLRQVKGIGEKTLQRIIEQFDDREYINENVERDELIFNHIYHGDVLDVLGTFPDDSIDLIVTSPPYNIKDFHANQLRYSNYEGNNIPENVYQDWIVSVLNELYRVLKEEGSLMFNHKVRIRNGEMIHPMEFLNKSKFIMKQEIVWWQAKGANTDKIRFYPFSERIYWMTKSNKTKMNNEYNFQDVIRYTPTHKRKETKHPAVMPEHIAEVMIKPFPESNIVLDPFAGIGTTCKVAKKLGKKYIGIELDEEYFEIAKERINY